MDQPQFLRKIPLTIKMVLLTVFVGVTVAFVLNYFQSRTVKNIFQNQLKERLSLESQEDRIRFDNYIKAHHQSVKLLISQRQLQDFFNQSGWLHKKEIIFHRKPPKWLPRSSVLRSLVQIRHALLLDSKGMTRQVYQSIPEQLPQALLHPTELLFQLSHNQAFMTTLEGKPYLLASESLRNDSEETIATILLASPLDEEFLIASQGLYHGRIFALLTFALVTGENPKVLISTEPGVLPSGTFIDDAQNHYLITGKSLFDYGASDLLLGFASFVPLDEIETLTASVLARDRQQRGITVFILVSAFAVIMYCITRRITKLTTHVSEFSEKVLQARPQKHLAGDEINILENRFQNLTKEVVASQKIIQRDYDFQSTISSILQMSLDPIPLEQQLERILAAIVSLPFLSLEKKGSIFLVNTDPKILIMKAQLGLSTETLKTCSELPFGKCLCGKAAEKREIVFADCVDDRHEILCAGIKDHGHYCVPILLGQTVLGALNLYVDMGHERNPDEEKLLISVANTLAGIIERQKSEQMRQKLQADLIQADKLSALGRLTANIAHEIRNPLTLVGGFARRLQKKISPDLQEVKYVELIISEVSRLEKILMNVLTYSREDHLELEYHDLTRIIEKTLLIFDDKFQTQKIRIQKEFSSDDKIMIDQDQIVGVLNNLITNAIDAMADGGTLTINTQKEMVNDVPFLNLKISDTGGGIPEEKISMIFEPFFTTKVLGQGTGLGLPICKKTVEDHGGFINFSSEVNKGSTFSLFFPMSVKM